MCYCEPYRASKKNRDSGLLHVLHYFFSYKIENHPFKDLYLKIHTIGYYSGFYSSLNDKSGTNGVHFEFYQRIKKNIIFVIYAFKNLEKQMILCIQDTAHQQKYLKLWVIQN